MARDESDDIQVKRLEGWMSFQEAARIFGLTKMGVIAMVWDGMQFDIDKDVRAVGDQPLYLLRIDAVMAKKEERELAANAAAAARAERDKFRAKLRRR